MRKLTSGKGVEDRGDLAATRAHTGWVPSGSPAPATLQGSQLYKRQLAKCTVLHGCSRGPAVAPCDL